MVCYDKLYNILILCSFYIIDNQCTITSWLRCRFETLEIRVSNSKVSVFLFFLKKRTSPKRVNQRTHNTQSLHKPTRKRHEKYLKYEFVESRKTTTEKVCDTRVDVSREYLDDRGGS